MTTRSSSTPSTRSTSRRRSTGTTSPRGKSSLFRSPEIPGFTPGRLRDEAGLLHEQGRHARPDVPRPQEGAQARRHATRRCSTATAASTSTRRRTSARCGSRCSSRASSTPRRTCAAAASTARSGTRPGMKLKKQNVFDDFIAAAEWLDQQQVHVADKARHPRRARTAGCSSARSPTSAPTCSRRSSSRPA